MVALRIITETVNAPSLFPDTVWDGFVGDYAPAAPNEPSNFGGLRARAPLETAALLCLMTDARAQASDSIPDGSGDPRGWCGDQCDPTAAPIGSRLWLLRRSILSDEVARAAEGYAREALQTLIAQKAVASIDVAASANLAAGRLELFVKLYKQDGTLSASTNFSLLWDRNHGVSNPLDR